MRWGWRGGSAGFAYTEVTAYGLLLLLRFGRSDDRVDATARHLLAVQHLSGAFLHRPGADEAYTFDTAICTSALAELALADGDPLHREAALRGGRWLLESQRADGSFPSRYRPSAHAFDTRAGENTFWGDGAALHGKISLAFVNCEKLCPGEGFLAGARRVCRWVHEFQDSDGRIRMRPSSPRTFLHAHCYASEGLLATAGATSSNELGRAGRAAVDWLATAQRRSGGLPAWRGTWRRPGMMVSDATAQAVRLWSVADGPTRHADSIRRALRYLLAMQCHSGPETVRGAFRAASYGVRPVLLRPRVFPAWCTIFAVHALRMHSRRLAGDHLGPEELF
jgi:hypothetical protein